MASLLTLVPQPTENTHTHPHTVVPNRWNREFFTHTYEGDDDMPGHVKSSLVGAGVCVPLGAGGVELGSEVDVYLCEHRDVGGWGGGHNRRVCRDVTSHNHPFS